MDIEINYSYVDRDDNDREVLIYNGLTLGNYPGCCGVWIISRFQTYGRVLKGKKAGDYITFDKGLIERVYKRLAHYVVYKIHAIDPARQWLSMMDAEYGEANLSEKNPHKQRYATLWGFAKYLGFKQTKVGKNLKTNHDLVSFNGSYRDIKIEQEMYDEAPEWRNYSFDYIYAKHNPDLSSGKEKKGKKKEGDKLRGSLFESSFPGFNIYSAYLGHQSLEDYRRTQQVELDQARRQIDTQWQQYITTTREVDSNGTG